MDNEYKRESFLFYQSFRKMANRLPKDKRLGFYEMIFEFGLTGVEPKETGDDLIDMAMEAIKPIINANIRNYINGCKGGAPSESMRGNQNARKKKQTQNKPKTNPEQTQNKGNENVNVNDNDNDTVNDNLHSTDSTNPTIDDSTRLPTLEELEARGVLAPERKRGIWD